jgi:uncharacterized protein YuzE
MKKQQLSQSHNSKDTSVQLEFATYNNKIQAIYMRFRKDKIMSTQVIGRHCDAVVDLNVNGEVIGIEMLKPGVLRFKTISKKFNLPAISEKIFDSANCAFA